MDTEIVAQKREILGKAVNRLRETGVIPAELYGHNVKNIHLGLPKKEFSDVFKVAGENEIINLVIDNKKIPVLVHDIQKNFLTDEIIHVDFYQVKMTEKIIVATPLDFIGEAPAIKEKDGVLVKAMHEIKVEALPTHLPHSIKVDLASLDDIGKSIHVGDLSISKNVKVLVEPQTVVATITEKTKEEVVVEEPKVDEIVTEAEAKRIQAEKEEGTEETAGKPAKPAK